MNKLNIGKDLYLKGRIGWQGLSKDEYLEKSDYKIINATSLMDGYVDWNNCGYITKERYEEAKEIQLQENDILISKDGTLGKIGYVKNLITPCSVSSGIFVLRNVKSNLINFDYLYHILKSPVFKDFIKRNKAQGSTIPHLYQRDLENFEIDVPCLDAQNEIANALNLLDKKIETNNKLNDELEAMAKTLYDYWFLQFEFPNEDGKSYKSSGGKMVWNDEFKREIPEGWKVIKLSKILKKVNREFDSSKESRAYDLSKIPSNSITINDTSSSKEFKTNLFSVKEGDILFGSIRPYLRKAGVASYDGAVAGTIHCYEVRNKYDYNLALFTVSSENLFIYAINNSKGTKMPVVSSDDLLEFMIPYNEKLAKEFNELSIKDKIISNVHQSNELSSLRNFLLPLLMNGQVTFKE